MTTFNIIDSDHHLYEPDDCFTRRLESRYADRAMQGPARKRSAQNHARQCRRPVGYRIMTWHRGARQATVDSGAPSPVTRTGSSHRTQEQSDKELDLPLKHGLCP
jgi:hypothetical protein